MTKRSLHLPSNYEPGSRLVVLAKGEDVEIIYPMVNYQAKYEALLQSQQQDLELIRELVETLKSSYLFLLGGKDMAAREAYERNKCIKIAIQKANQRLARCQVWFDEAAGISDEVIKRLKESE